MNGTVLRTIELGREIAENGLIYVEDGHDIMELLSIWAGQVKAHIDGEDLVIYLHTRLSEWAQAFGWDNVYQDPSQEDAVYGMFVNIYVNHVLPNE